MRISSNQVQVYVQVLSEIISDFELFLFGSRAKDSSRGGDIDLLVLAEEEDIQKLRNQKALILTRMKVRSTDERIDLTMISRQKAAQDPFLGSIPQEELILLHPKNHGRRS